MILKIVVLVYDHALYMHHIQDKLKGVEVECECSICVYNSNAGRHALGFEEYYQPSHRHEFFE